MIDRLVALAAVETVQVGGVFHQLRFAQMILEAASQRGLKRGWRQPKLVMLTGLQTPRLRRRQGKGCECYWPEYC